MPLTAPPAASPSADTVTAAVARRAADERGFTLIEVLVATFVLVTGLMALLGILDVASHTNQTNRVRQEATNVAREAVEDVRSLPYTQLATPTSIAAALQPQLTPNATLSGSTVTLIRSSVYSFSVSFTTCSLDDPSDGYGNHGNPPASGGSWCADVAPSGTTDSNPDDYKRVSVTVTPTGSGGAARTYPVQQTVLIYNRPTNGPAVSCLTTSTCPGTNQLITSGSSVTFNVTTTAPASAIQWLVNGNPPPAAQIPALAFDPYTPPVGSSTSPFTWTLPTAGGNVIDGTYTIAAVAFDANGNSGSRSTLQITVNEHPVVAPTGVKAGWDQLINGVDVQWLPSIDQDVLYYHVYRQSGASAPVQVSCLPPGGLRLMNVPGTSCTDPAAPAPNVANMPTCSNNQTSYTTPDLYYVVGVDTDPNTQATREGQKSATWDANYCDHPPAPPGGLTGVNSNGALNLSWAAPAAPVDPDSWDTIQAWRIYRWPASLGTAFPGAGYRLQLVGTSGANPVTSATDNSPDPGGAPQYYCVTSVDTALNESGCSSPLLKW